MKQFVILLARRSTQGQEHSFKHQIREAEKAFPNFKPNKVIKISESGDDKRNEGIERTMFNTQFVSLVRKKLQEGFEVLCYSYKVDRFTRNYTDYGTIVNLFKLGAKFYANDGKLEIESEIFTFGIQVGLAQNYLTQIKVNSRNGRITALKEGRAICGFIPGYQATKKAGIRKINPITSQAIQLIFKEFSSGKYSLKMYLPQASKIAKRFGFNISSIEGLRKMLRNPFYVGLVKYTGKDIPEFYGKTFKSASPTIIPVDLWEKVQSIIDNRVRKKTHKHNFIYRGRIKTPKGFLLVGAHKKEKKYVFYEAKQEKLKALNQTKIDNHLNHYFKNLPFNVEKSKELAKESLKNRQQEIKNLKNSY